MSLDPQKTRQKAAFSAHPAENPAPLLTPMITSLPATVNHLARKFRKILA
jgi:hypothetical protein